MHELLILFLALGLDVILGEPPERFHPTVWMGKFSKKLSSSVQIGNPRKELIWGSFLAITVIALFSIGSILFIEISRLVFGSLAYIICSAIVLKTTFAIKSLRNHVSPILRAMQEGSTEEARMALQKVVRRDTKRLDEQQIISAAIETVAEGSVDGIVSPLFYFGAFGVSGAVAYRAVNTLDSIVGYRERRYEYVGKFPAKLDTVANFIPARFTAFLIIISALILGEDWRNAWRILKRDHGKTQSVNAGWPMAAVAGALNIQLEKPQCYILGDKKMLTTALHIARAFRITYVMTILFVLMMILPIIALNGVLN
ncbi:MAG: cobalamin biosynthesis protein [Thaumarchaeota archaeon]|nr:cobalamin biosynthesis protein [Nitrososphaerota archaeon]